MYLLSLFCIISCCLGLACCCMGVFQLLVFYEITFRIVVASTSNSSAHYEASLVSLRGGLDTEVLAIVFKGDEVIGACS